MGIISRIRTALLRKYYHKIYHRLFWFYAKKYDDADCAGNEAGVAFIWLTGREWKDVIHM